MLIKLTSEDLLKNRNLDAGWYGAIFKGCTVGPAAPKPGKPSSVNYTFSFEIEKDGRTMERVFNSQAMGMMEHLVDALTGASTIVDSNGKPAERDFDPDAHIGKKLKVKVEDEPYQGRLVSKVNDFLPYEANTEQPF